MAQTDKDKSTFLSKLARFVANPTTDWSALDKASQGQKGHAGGEGLELTQDEIFAIRYQRRKDNRNIRIKEFAVLRQIRAGASVSKAYQSVHSNHSAGNSGGAAAPSAQAVAVSPHPTNMAADFRVSEISRIEEQMAGQWWDKSDAKAKARKVPKVPGPVPEAQKTQMLIETQIATYSNAADLQNSDVIPFDPAFLEPIPAQTSASTPAAEPVVPVSPERGAATPPPHTAQAAEPVAAPPVQMQDPQPASAQAVAAEPVAEQTALKPVHVSAPTAVTHAQPAAEVRRSGKEPVAPIHGSGEQVDFSETDSAQAPATFVYRNTFSELTDGDGDTPIAGDALPQEGELPQQPLTPADAQSMAAAQAVQDELVADSDFPPAVLPPEYTPEDLPECLNEPAIRFVQGDNEQTETQLLQLAQAEQMAAQTGQAGEEPHISLALLDFYRCTGQEEKFEAASIQMVRHFDRSAPQYQGADLGEATLILSTLGTFPEIDYSLQNGWRCPAELDSTDVMLLRSQLITSPAQVLLDWRALQAILDDAVEPLLDQFRDLAGRKVDLLMWGGRAFAGLLRAKNRCTERYRLAGISPAVAVAAGVGAHHARARRVRSSGAGVLRGAGRIAALVGAYPLPFH